MNGLIGWRFALFTVVVSLLIVSQACQQQVWKDTDRRARA